MAVIVTRRIAGTSELATLSVSVEPLRGAVHLQRNRLTLLYDRPVAFWDPVERHHVLQAVAEYDELGQDEFLARYGFGRARAYLLVVDGETYDSKAVLGVAYRYATGRPLGSGDFSGGVHGAAGVLRDLRFEVRSTHDPLPGRGGALDRPDLSGTAQPRPAATHETVADLLPRLMDSHQRGAPAGHAFISYVREDSHHVDRLQQALEAASVRVWRDTADLWPGEDWRAKIRHAITDDALVFLACFSSASLSRARSYQNEELALAIDQMRLRRPDQPWLIPVRFDDCDIPELDIGGGRSLTSIQRADLLGDHFGAAAARLTTAVLRILRYTA